MKQNIKKILPKLLLFLLFSIVVIIVIFSMNDIKDIGEVLKNIKPIYLLIAFIFLLLYMFFYPLSLYILGRSKDKENIKFRDSLMIGSIEYFFNGITPFSSGGQPFQVYAYKKIGVSLHKATGIILMNFVISQMAIVILCIISLFFFNQLTNNTLYLQIMIIVGLVINILIFLLFCSVGISKTIRRLLTKFVSFILNLKIFKGKLTKHISAFDEYCEGAQNTFKSLFNQKLKFLLCIIFKLTGMVCYYIIPFFILLSLGIDVKMNQLLVIIAMTTFSIAMTCYIPTPGATGGIEFAFRSLFITIIPTLSASMATSGLLLWRFITYYFLMLISFIIYVIFEQITNRRNKKQKLNNIEDKNLENV